jgi:hypothetical protein
MGGGRDIEPTPERPDEAQVPKVGVDSWVATHAERVQGSRLAAELGREIRTIVWATGYRPDFSWLDLPALDRNGWVRHDGGVVTDAAGMYVLGMPFLRRRRSSFIHGANADTHDLAEHLHRRLGTKGSSASSMPPPSAPA